MTDEELLTKARRLLGEFYACLPNGATTRTEILEWCKSYDQRKAGKREVRDWTDQPDGMPLEPAAPVVEPRIPDGYDWANIDLECVCGHGRAAHRLANPRVASWPQECGADTCDCKVHRPRTTEPRIPDGWALAPGWVPMFSGAEECLHEGADGNFDCTTAPSWETVVGTKYSDIGVACADHAERMGALVRAEPPVTLPNTLTGEPMTVPTLLTAPAQPVSAMPPGFRVVGRSGPGVPLPVVGQWVQWRHEGINQDPDEPRQVYEGELAGELPIAFHWRAGRYDILEPVEPPAPDQPEPAKVPLSERIREARKALKRVMVTRGEDGRLHSAPPVVLAQLSAFHQLADEAAQLEAKLDDALALLDDAHVSGTDEYILSWQERRRAIRKGTPLG